MIKMKDTRVMIMAYENKCKSDGRWRYDSREMDEYGEGKKDMRMRMKLETLK